MTKNLAFLFPGQGSQSVGMLDALAAEYPIILNTFQEAADHLHYNLWDLVHKGPESQLNQTEFTQPALLASSVALWRLWQQQEQNQPAWLAGHSLGEYSALVCANALDYGTALQLVALRGKYMQEAVPAGQGGMAVIIGLEDTQIEAICRQAGQQQILAPANYNAIGQTVVAGETAAVLQAIALAKEAGALMAKLLPVSVPSHCLLMQPAADRLAEYLHDISIRPPEIPILSNVDVAVHPTAEEIRIALIRQLYSPVLWVQTIQHLIHAGVTQFVECGPGKVLAGLNKRIDGKINTISLGIVKERNFKQGEPTCHFQEK
jgi:[acyl-carrier-protein] S-malonyltransferase